MKNQSSAILASPHPLSTRAGLWWGLLGVTAFSFTLPLTRVALGALSPQFIGAGRAVVAAALAAVALLVTRQLWPTRRQWARLCIVAGGIVIGFPMLTSYALQTAPASHGAMVIGLLPAATAVMAVIRGKERPSRSFWVFALLGAIAALFFTSLQHGGWGGLHWSDVLLFGAVVAAAVGYAEGGLLARELGAWQTVSWALLAAAPLMVALLASTMTEEWPRASTAQWAAFLYLGVVSMFLGFFAWYRGLAIGPMAQVSQMQLAQPVMTMLWAALLLGEHLGMATILGGSAVILSAALAVRARSRRKDV